MLHQSKTNTKIYLKDCKKTKRKDEENGKIKKK